MHEITQLLHDLPFQYWLGLSALIGLCIGSFLNVVSYRLAIRLQCIERPAAIHLLWSRSFCPQCQHLIAWYDNLPLLSFCLNKGRCRHCRQPIAWLYPAVELATASLTTIIFLHYGSTCQSLGAAAICWWLIPLAILDFKYFLLPNELTFSLIAFGVMLNYFTVFSTLSSAIIGAISGYTILALIDSAYYWWRKQHGIGQGDWKLFAALGACFGWQSLLPILLLASFSATVVGCCLMFTHRATLKSELPFGVFLSFAGILMVVSDIPAYLLKLVFN